MKRDQRPPFYLSTPLELVPMVKVPGEIGIEIEVEGRELPKRLTSDYWTVHTDGSLHGEDNAEYVLATPVPRDKVDAALQELQGFFVKKKSKLEFSNRCSVHVHINVQELTFKQIFTFLTCYFIVEDLLTEWCGPDRIGNMFCLRVKDAEYIIDLLRGAIADNNVRHLSQQAYRYAGANVVPSVSFGSVEFRSMRGTADPDVINPWVEMLTSIKDASLQFANPIEVIQAFSMMGPTAFLRMLEPKYYDIFSTMAEWDHRMHEGMRYAQDIAFASDWAAKKEDFKKEATPKKKGNSYIDQVNVPGWGFEPVRALQPGTVFEDDLVDDDFR
jgi:putative amidoligase enzyme